MKTNPGVYTSSFSLSLPEWILLATGLVCTVLEEDLKLEEVGWTIWTVDELRPGMFIRHMNSTHSAFILVIQTGHRRVASRARHTSAHLHLCAAK